MQGIKPVLVDPDTGEVHLLEPGPPLKRSVGRPRGATNLRSREASRVLAQLGFDPIAEKVKTHDECTKLIRAEQLKEKPSKMYIAQLIAIKDKCENDLLRFGYSRVSESVDVNHNVSNIPPMLVTLTPEGWKPGDPTPGNTGSETDDIIIQNNGNTPAMNSSVDTYPDYTEQGERRLEEIANEEDNV